MALLFEAMLRGASPCLEKSLSVAADKSAIVTVTKDGSNTYEIDEWMQNLDVTLS